MIDGVAAVEVTRSLAWNSWVSLGTAVVCFVFVVVYTLVARWWKTYEGKVMVGKAVAIGLLALYTFLAVQVVPESEPMRWARVGIVAVIGVFMLAQTWRLITTQIDRNRHRRTR